MQHTSQTATICREQLVKATASMQMEQAQRIAFAVDEALAAVKERERQLQADAREAAELEKQQQQAEAWQRGRSQQASTSDGV